MYNIPQSRLTPSRPYLLTSATMFLTKVLRLAEDLTKVLKCLDPLQLKRVIH
jgi:hypothetical protein